MFGAILVIVLYALLQEKASNRIRVILLLGILTMTITTILLEFDVLPSYTVSRLDEVLSDPTQLEPVRVTLLKKAWFLALDHPVFGVGLGNFRGFYHPIVEESTTALRRLVALSYQAHNTYAELLAEVGFPGLFFFLGMLGVVLKSCVGKTSAPDVRVGICMLAGVLFDRFFHTGLGVLFWYPMAFLLGALLEQRAVSHEGEKVKDAELS